MAYLANTFDCIILGAGAAGLMAALTAGQRGRRVLLLDHADKVGKKILISGGGRCNFTNIGCSAQNFLSANPHFAKSALARYTQHDFLEMVNRHGIAWHEKTLGQLFCDGSARQIVDMLLAECAVGAVETRLNCTVQDVSRSDDYTVTTSQGVFQAPALILATGGLSIPKMGATGFAHDLATRFGLKLADVRPGLVPLTFSNQIGDFMRGLSGVALPCIARADRTAFDEAMLFTHRGLSGPAILQISSYWRDGGTIRLDIAPDLDAAAHLLAMKRDRPKAQPATILAELLPARLATALAAQELPHRPMAEIADAPLRKLGAMLNGWDLTPSGSEGYAKAEVTAGGIDTASLSSRTMEAKAVPGLHVIGEAVDVTGWLGGYNFQWAWASGRAAGEAV
ncbi:MAG: NAD(P)/FAD-dependent oxidoreductase [Minwuia sp.]|nr:NAD(P)/FAD-dependent oxidoreductase [Minwuia sp.]